VKFFIYSRILNILKPKPKIISQSHTQLFSEGWEAVSSNEKLHISLQKARQGLEWVIKVEDLSVLNKIPKGKLSRMLLPFKEDTDAKDQSKGGGNKGSPELDNIQGFESMDERIQLVQSAMNVRKFLRIKVADCADFEFLKDNLLLIIAFFQNLQCIFDQNQTKIVEKNNGRVLTLSEFLREELGQPIAHKFRVHA